MVTMNWFEKLLCNNFLWDIFTHWYASKALKSVPQVSGRVLEIGCGKGITTEIIANSFPKAKIIAIDADPKQILLAKQNIKPHHKKQIKFIQANAETIPFTKEYFDAVFQFNTFHHIPKWHKALKEASRILRKKGIFFVFDVGKWFTKTIHALTFSKDLTHLSKKKFINQMRKQGITISQEKGNDFVFLVVGTKLI